MLVKQKYCDLSEQLMYEWSQLLKPTAYNKSKTQAYAFWQSIKNEEFSELSFNEIVRIDKIKDAQWAELKPRNFKRK